MEQKIFVAEQSGAGLQRESARLGSEKRCRPASAWSPPSWKKFDAKHREAPTISLDPPGNEPDVTQNGKGRQCVSARFRSENLFSLRKNSRRRKKRNAE